MHIHRTKAAIAGVSLCAAFYCTHSWLEHADKAEAVTINTHHNSEDDFRKCTSETTRMIPPKDYIKTFMNGCLLGRVNFAKAEKIESHQSAEFRDMFLAATLGALGIVMGFAAVGPSRKEDQIPAQTPK